MNWQPIETAPMDGTPILLWEPPLAWRDESGYVFSGKFSPTRNKAVYGTGWECLEYNAFNHYPTHWMPLPEPPK